MKFLRFAFFAPLFLFVCRLAAQQPMDVIINEIYNDASQNLEWTEILVVKDGISLIGVSFGDNNGSTNSWQTKIRFKNNLLWQRLRAGTYIVINHASSTATCNSQPEDTDRSDGFIRVCSKNTTYFSGGSSSTLSIAGSGDFLHLVDRTGEHLHGLGFDENPGGSVEGGTCQNVSLSWRDTTTDVSNLRPCDFYNFYRFNCPTSQSLANLSGNFPADYNSKMNADSINPRIGFLISPTPGQGNSFQNQTLIASWREPQIDSQVVCARTNNQGTTFSWQMALDVNPLDNTTGYLVLKTVGSVLFPDPVDGRLYAVGDTLRAGGVKAVVLAIKNNSFDTSQLDQANTGGALPIYYRVYAFRYTNTPGISSFDRGRAYNTSRFVRIAPGNLLPPTVSRITDICAAGPVTLRALPNVIGTVYEWRPQSRISFPVPGINGFEYTFPALPSQDSVFVNYRSSALGCISGVTKFIIDPPPVFSASTLSAPSLICPGDTFEISVNGPRTSVYLWEIPAVFSTLNPVVDTTTRIRLVARSSTTDSTRFAVRQQTGQCLGIRITSNFLLRQKPAISITGNTLLKYGDGTTLVITTDGLASWLNANGSLLANSNTLLLNALGETTTFIGKTEIVGSTGCVNTLSQTVTVLPRPDILIPNVITPGLKDGKNDVFIVKGATFKNLLIFNRWGKKVFEADTYQNDWAGEEEGTYFYEALLDDGFVAEKQKGIIQVLR